MGKKGGAVRIKQMGPKMAAPPSLEDFMLPAHEIISLPPKMDSNITQIWPASQSYSMKYKSNEFSCIWPSYLDQDKTMKQGRRISKELSLIRPTVTDISEVLQFYGVRHAIQPYKGYPRDIESQWYNPGRVLYDLNMMQNALGVKDNLPQIVEINDDDDIPDMNEGNITQKKIWKVIALKMKDMPGRQLRVEEARKKDEANKKKALEEERLRAVVSKKGISTAGGNNKKGKKKR